MAIPDEDVAQVRAATDIIALVGEHTALKRVGRRFVGLCPFHAENSASFSVNAEEGLYYCFGCQASGDAITFVRAIEGCDFVEAVERLAARGGITVRNEEDERSGIERGRRRQLYDVLATAVEFYHERLLNGRDAGPARQYLRARGYDGAVVRQFRLGFAPARHDELSRRINGPSGLLVEAGLAWGGHGKLQDAFRERIIFPIFDPGGRPIALGGRVLPPELRQESRDPGPKYRNSPESAIYQKRRTLYGLNWAKNEMARLGEAVVCEGYTDVVGFFRAGIPRAVATCGTSLTEDHFRLLANFAKRIVLSFDSDSAGQNAAARLYEWERRHDVELVVANLPAGSDPAELAGSDPAALAAAVSGAQPFLGFQVDRAIAAAGLGSPEGRARAAKAAIALVAEHPDELVRDHYLVEIADRTHHDPTKLRPLLETGRRSFLETGSSGAHGPGSRTRSRAGVRPARPSEPGRPGRTAGAAGAAGAARPVEAGGTSHPSQLGGPPRRADSATTAATHGSGPATHGSGPTSHGSGSGDPWPAYDEPDGEWTGPGPLDRPGTADPATPRGARGARGDPSPPGRRATLASPRAGLEALALAIHRPAEVAQLFDEVMFTDPLQREAFRALAHASDLHQAIDGASPQVAELLRWLAVTDVAPDADCEGTFVAVVRGAVETVLVELNREARQAGPSGEAPSGDKDALRNIATAVAALKEELELLRDPVVVAGAASPATDAARRLVAWMSQREGERR